MSFIKSLSALALLAVALQAQAGTETVIECQRQPADKAEKSIQHEGICPGTDAAGVMAVLLKFTVSPVLIF